jgi:hypothetical protein
VAASGDEVWVAQGSYLPGALASSTFDIPDGVQVFGGFSGDEVARSERDCTVNVTVLSGDIGVVDDATDNVEQVVTTSSATAGTVLDGFTITGGYTRETWPDYNGAGIYNDGGSPLLRNLIIEGNSAYGRGAGMYDDGGSPTLEDVVIRDNVIRGSGGDGGGLYHSGGLLTLTRVSIERNNGRLGGGIALSGGSAVLIDVVLEGNVATNSGGGMYVSTGGSVSLSRVVFEDNHAEYGGGLSCRVGPSPIQIEDVTFLRNSAMSQGGGMSNQKRAVMRRVAFLGNSAQRGGGLRNYGVGTQNETVLREGLFVGNTSQSYGGGLFNEMEDGDQGFLTVVSSTFSANHAQTAGGAVHNYGSFPSGGGPPVQLVGCVFWGDSATGSTAEIGRTWDEATVTHSDVAGGFTGTGNIDSDPQFLRPPSAGTDGVFGTVDDDYGDLRLGYQVAAIDAGDNAAVTSTVDLSGGPRLLDDAMVADTGNGTAPIVDMGAYESQSPIFVSAFESGGHGDWSSATP